MAKELPATGDVARPRLRSAITTIVVILISVMIVRDIFVRLWSSPSAPAADTTQHSR
jgi:hypothetical protein